MSLVSVRPAFPSNRSLEPRMDSMEIILCLAMALLFFPVSECDFVNVVSTQYSAILMHNDLCNDIPVIKAISTDFLVLTRAQSFFPNSKYHIRLSQPC